MRMPASAPLPVPTMIAVGVARPMAQGQAMISTAIALARAYGQPRLGAEQHPAREGQGRDADARPGTNQPVTRSATRWIGAFEPWARSTSATIWDSVVSRPTRSARMTNEPRGVHRRADDPVAGDLLDRQRLAGEHRLVHGGRARRSRRRRPAPARRAGRARGRRPPPGRAARHARLRRAARARCPAAAEAATSTAPAAWPLARASSHRPRRIRPMMTAAESK